MNKDSNTILHKLDFNKLTPNSNNSDINEDDKIVIVNNN